MKTYLFNEREVCDNAELHGVPGSQLDQQARRDGLVVSMRDLTIVKRSITSAATNEISL